MYRSQRWYFVENTQAYIAFKINIIFEKYFGAKHEKGF